MSLYLCSMSGLSIGGGAAPQPIYHPSVEKEEPLQPMIHSRSIIEVWRRENCYTPSPKTIYRPGGEKDDLFCPPIHSLFIVAVERIANSFTHDPQPTYRHSGEKRELFHRSRHSRSIIAAAWFPCGVLNSRRCLFVTSGDMVG